MALSRLEIQLLAEISDLRAKLKTGQKDFRGLGRAAEEAGRTASLALTLPLAAIGAAAVKAASDFESSFAGIRKTVDASESDFQRLKQEMLDLSEQKPIDVDQLNRIGELGGQLGVQADNLVAFTSTIADLGETTNLSVEEAATSFARLANIMQEPQDRFDEMGSVVVELGNNLATTEQEITAMSLRFASAARVARITTPQVLAIAGALSSVGIEAQAGGTAVQKAIISINAAVESGGQELALFAQVAGQSADEFEQKFRQDAAGAFADFIEGLGRIQQSGGNVFAVLEALGLQEVRLRNALLSAAVAGDLLRGSLDLAGRAAEENTALTEEANKRYATFEGQIKLTLATLRRVAIEVGDVLLPPLRVMLGTVRDLAGRLKNLDPSLIRFAAGFGLVAAAIGPVLVAVGTILRFAAMANPVFLAAAAGLATLAGVAAVAAGNVNDANKELSATATVGAMTQSALDTVEFQLRKLGLVLEIVFTKLAFGLVNLLADIIPAAMIDLGEAAMKLFERLTRLETQLADLEATQTDTTTTAKAAGDAMKNELAKAAAEARQAIGDLNLSLQETVVHLDAADAHVRVFLEREEERLKKVAEGLDFQRKEEKALLDATQDLILLREQAAAEQKSATAQRLASLREETDARIDEIDATERRALEAIDALVENEEKARRQREAITASAERARTAVFGAESHARDAIFAEQADRRRELEERLVLETKTGSGRRIQAIEYEMQERIRLIGELEATEQEKGRLLVLATQASEQAKREELAKTKGFWRQQLEDVVASNVFSLSTITTNFASSTAQWIRGVGDFKSFWDSTMQTLLQTAIQLGIQGLAHHLLTETSKTAITQEQAAARAASETAASGVIAAAGNMAAKALLAGASAVVSGLGVVAQVAGSIMSVLAQEIAAFLTALAHAVASVPFVGPFLAGLLLAGAAVVSAAGAAITGILGGLVGAAAAGLEGMRSGLGVTELAEGGIFTRPTFLMAQVAERGPEAFAPLDKLMGMVGPRREDMVQHINVQLDSRELIKAVVRGQPSVLLAKGKPAR